MEAETRIIAETRVIIAQPLTQRGFARYGEMIGTELIDGEQVTANAADAPGSTSINGGTAQRSEQWTDLAAHGGAACVALFRTQGHAAPLRLSVFERHCLGSQTFVPLGQSRCLAVVAGSAEAPDEDRIEAFIVEPGQGVTLRRGVWHHPLLTPAAADVLVIERRAGAIDCDIVAIDGRFIVTLAP
jgi:ureidoglycolate lyase